MVIFTLFRTKITLCKQQMSFEYKGMSFRDILKKCRKSSKIEIFKNALELNSFTLDP